MRQRLGTALLERVDLLVELTTLGEYGLGDDGLPLAIGGDAPRVRAVGTDDCREGGAEFLGALAASARVRVRDGCAPAAPLPISRRAWRARP